MPMARHLLELAGRAREEIEDASPRWLGRASIGLDVVGELEIPAQDTASSDLPWFSFSNVMGDKFYEPFDRIVFGTPEACTCAGEQQLEEIRQDAPTKSPSAPGRPPPLLHSTESRWRLGGRP